MSDTFREILDQALRDRSGGRFEQARVGFLQALEKSTLNNDRQGRLLALKGLAQVARDSRRPVQALPFLKEATQLARDTGDEIMIAHTIRHLADTFCEIGQAELARPLYLEAVQIFQNNPMASNLDLANSLRPAALLFESLGDYSRASSFWQEAREGYSAAAIEDGVAECDEGIRRCSRSLTKS